MAKDANAIIQTMDSVAQSVRAMLAKAREEKDVVKTLCLDDKLTQIDVARQSASERADALKQALASQDQELASHEYTILLVLKERVGQLSAEANQCIGVEAGFVGDSKITIDIDPNLPSDDPSQYPVNPIITDPPGCVSCMQ
jgi:hypothetical protein